MIAYCLRNRSFSFSKEKLIPLRAIMPLVVVAYHLELTYHFLCIIPVSGPVIVSIFFFISGYGLSYSYKKKGNDYLNSFFSHRYTKVLLPFVLASILYSCSLFLWPLSEDIFKSTIMGGRIPFLPFGWFVLVLMYFYTAFYLSYRFFSKPWNLIVLCFFVGMYLFEAVIKPLTTGWWLYVLGFPTGVLFAQFEGRLYSCFEKSVFSYWISLVALFLILLAAHFSDNEYIHTICYACIPLLVAIIVARLPLEKLNVKVISFLDQISYEVFLCHGVAITWIGGHFYVQNDVLFILLVYALTIALAWGIHLLSGWVFRKSIAPSLAR